MENRHGVKDYPLQLGAVQHASMLKIVAAAVQAAAGSLTPMLQYTESTKWASLTPALQNCNLCLRLIS